VSNGGDITDASFTLGNSTISGNTVTAGGGGSGGSAGDGTFTEGGIKYAGADGGAGDGGSTAGGGIHSDSATMALTQVTIAFNKAATGAGIFIGTAGSGDVTINNSTIAENTATIQGGGIMSIGGASNDSITLISTIIAANHAPTNSDLSGTFTVDHDLIQSVGSATLVGTDSDAPTDISTTLTGIDPLLDVLTNNGGTTETMLLKTGSQAIDHGSNPLSLATDQRGTGFSRSLGTEDIGAVEVGTVAASG
jgi:hypothetical protein